MKEILAMLAIVLLSSVYALLPSYVMMDVAKLTRVPLLNELALYQWYGIYMIIRIGIIHNKNKKADPDEVIDNALVVTLRAAISLLAVWGLIHLVFHIFFR
jgi:hypothetical protein